jgi:outer membrane protein assembly factor BamE (lipoprotein component of BamABCDE complex)
MLIIVSAALLLQSCGSVYHAETGTKNLNSENVAKIVDGKTTKEEVRSLFGNPMTVTTNQFGETWMYNRGSRDSNLMGWTTQMEAHGLVVTFDEKGIVKTKSYSVTQPVGSGVQQ